MTDLLIGAAIVSVFVLVIKLAAGRHTDPDSFRMKRPTLIEFPKDSPGYAIGLKQRDETIGRDQYRPQRIHGLIELQKRTR